MDYLLVAVALCVLILYMAAKSKKRRKKKKKDVDSGEMFVAASFSIMGYIASSDGMISKGEYVVINSIMNSLGLSDKLKEDAKRNLIFGARRDFDASSVLSDFINVCGSERDLLETFMKFQIKVAHADDGVSNEERETLALVAYYLGFSDDEFEGIEDQVISGIKFKRQQADDRRVYLDTLFNAYKVLDVEAVMSDEDIQRVYRRLMSKNHPDRLVSQGLSPDMMRLASDRCSEISSAYNFIMSHRAAMR